MLLYAVGAAVSLFRWRLMEAGIGGTVVAVIDGGQGLLAHSRGTTSLRAAMVDAPSRRPAAATGTG